MKRILINLLAFVSACSAQTPDLTLVYKQTPTRSLKLNVFNPEGHTASAASPAIVFFYGGGWNNDYPLQFYRQSRHLASRGMVAVCADYRTKQNGGVDPRGCVADAKSAMRWVRSHAAELGVDPDRIIAGGASAGGHLAAATALIDSFNEEGEDTSVSSRPAALILFNPVVDNGKGGFGFDRVRAYWQDFSPLHNIDSGAPPTLFILGTKDEYIPVSVGEAYKKRMDAAGVRCELLLYEDQAHSFFNSGPLFEETLQAADDFLVSLGYLAPVQ